MADDKQIDANDSFDTDQQYIAGVYAKALIGAADKNGTTEEVLTQLNSFVGDVLGKIPQLQEALLSPRRSVEERAGLIDKALGGRADKTLVNFLKVLNAKHRLDCLKSINARAKEFFNEKVGRVEARVTVADLLPEELRSSVVDKLKTMLGKDVILSVHTDPEIIGGMIVKVGDTVYDASVANRLRQVRESAVEGAMQKVRQSIETFATD